jgi:hypothetical protein
MDSCEERQTALSNDTQATLLRDRLTVPVSLKSDLLTKCYTTLWTFRWSLSENMNFVNSLLDKSFTRIHVKVHLFSEEIWLCYLPLSGSGIKFCVEPVSRPKPMYKQKY